MAQLPERIAAQEAALVPQQAPAQEAPADAFHAGLVRLWTEPSATGTTTLTGITQYSHQAPDFEAVILAPAGEAVPTTLTARTVAAVFDVPESAVSLAPVDGSGPGRMAVRVAPTAAAQQAVAEIDPGDYVRQVWEERVAAKGGCFRRVVSAPLREVSSRSRRNARPQRCCNDEETSRS